VYTALAKEVGTKFPDLRADADPARVTGGEIMEKLAQEFQKHCTDSEPMVRRTAASKLAEVAAAFYTTESHPDRYGALADKWIDLVKSAEQESIRVNALKASHAIFVNKTLTGSEAGAKFIACVNDQSWRVRVAVAESFSSVAQSLKNQSKTGEIDPTELEEAQEKFAALMKDSESEVRHVTAKHVAAVAGVLGAEWACKTIVPWLVDMILDEGVATRVELATR
jgi:hypothetical protein